MIWENTEGTAVLKPDPEKKPIKVEGLVMMKKALGNGETKFDAVVRYGDYSNLEKRLQEIGVKLGV